MPSTVSRFLVVGNGEVVQKHHLPAIAKLGGQVEIVRDYTGYVEALRDPRIQVVSICTPNYLHVNQAIMALEAGKKVILEKPIATTLESAQRLIDHPLSDKIAVCYQRRFNKQCQEIKERGLKPYRVDANIIVRRDKGYWNTWRSDIGKSGGGTLINIGIHYLDLLIWWFGDDYRIDFAKSAEHYGVDQIVHAEMHFGEIPVNFTVCALNSARDIEMKLLMQDEQVSYITDDATHLDIYDQFLNHNNYVSVKEAYKGLKLVDAIYKKANEN